MAYQDASGRCIGKPLWLASPAKGGATQSNNILKINELPS